MPHGAIQIGGRLNGGQGTIRSDDSAAGVSRRAGGGGNREARNNDYGREQACESA